MKDVIKSFILGIFRARLWRRILGWYGMQSGRRMLRTIPVFWLFGFPQKLSFGGLQDSPTLRATQWRPQTRRRKFGRSRSKAQKAQKSHDFYQFSAGGDGEGIPEDPLSWCVRQRTACVEVQLDWSTCSGNVMSISLFNLCDPIPFLYSVEYWAHVLRLEHHLSCLFHLN